MAIQQIGDFTYNTFDGSNIQPLATPTDAIMQGIKTLDSKHEQALDIIDRTTSNIKLANLNAADEPYRRELLSNATQAINAQVRNGNYAFALNEAKNQARQIALDEGLMNRSKTNEEYQSWRNSIVNSKDYPPALKEWILAKNKYAYGETVTDEGDTIRQTWDDVKRITGRPEAKHIPISDIVKNAMSYIKPESYGGDAILFRKADGSYTKDIGEADPSNPLPYLRTGSQITELTEDKIRNATLAYINSNTEAKASIQQEYDFLLDTDPTALVGDEGIILDISNFAVKQITGLSSQAAYKNVSSSQQPLDGMKYAAEKRLARYQKQMEQEQVTQAAYSGFPINTNVAPIQDYNKLQDQVTNSGNEIIRRMTNLGIVDFGDELTEADLSKLTNIDFAKLNMTPQAINNEISSIQRLAKDHFLNKSRIDNAKNEIIPNLSSKEIEADEFITSILSGTTPDNNRTYNEYRDKLNNFISKGGKVVYRPNVFQRATSDIEKVLTSNGVEYTKEGKDYIIASSIDNYIKYINSGIQDQWIGGNSFYNTQIDGIEPYSEDQSMRYAFHPVKAMADILTTKNNVNKKVANVVGNQPHFAQEQTAFDLKSFVQNDDQVKDIQNNVIAALRNPDSRQSIRVFSGSDKEGLYLQGDGLGAKEKDQIFSELFAKNNDIDIRIIPNSADGNPVLALTITGAEETKSKSAVLNKAYYVAADDLFNTVLNPVFNSSAFEVASDLSKLDLTSHNNPILVPSTFSGFDEGSIVYTNISGKRSLVDRESNVQFVGQEIDNVIGSYRQVDEHIRQLKFAGYDFKFDRDKMAASVAQDPYFNILVEAYAQAAYNRPTQSDKTVIANKIFDRYLDKYK